MKAGTKVKNKTIGDVGYVVNDFVGIMSVCFDGEALVVYEGTTYGTATKEEDLEIIGTYEATPNYLKCGAGMGAECCIFLTLGTGGFQCERFSDMRDTLLFRTMNSKRNPPEPFPDCMKFQFES